MTSADLSLERCLPPEHDGEAHGEHQERRRFWNFSDGYPKGLDDGVGCREFTVEIVERQFDRMGVEPDKHAGCQLRHADEYAPWPGLRRITLGLGEAAWQRAGNEFNAKNGHVREYEAVVTIAEPQWRKATERHEVRREIDLHAGQLDVIDKLNRRVAHSRTIRDEALWCWANDATQPITALHLRAEQAG